MRYVKILTGWLAVPGAYVSYPRLKRLRHIADDPKDRELRAAKGRERRDQEYSNVQEAAGECRFAIGHDDDIIYSHTSIALQPQAPFTSLRFRVGCFRQGMAMSQTVFACQWVYLSG